MSHSYPPEVEKLIADCKKQVEFYKAQIDTLAKFLMKHYGNEIGKTDNPSGEGAVDCAIRLLASRAEGQEIKR